MVAKPTPEQIRVLVETGLSDPEVDQFASDAAAMVGRCVASLESDLQQRIVAYVAAHLIASLGRGGESATLASRKLGDAQKTWTRSTPGEGLASTALGRQAIALDPTGCLETLGRKRVRVEVL